MSGPSRRSGFLTVLLCAVLTGSFGCNGSDATGPSISTDVQVLAAKGGVKGGPESTSDITVDDSDPREAPQDTMLSVRILGSGFEPGAQVRFLIGGKETEKVTTLSSTFVSSTEVVADVSIALDADTVFYDIEVANSPRRRGVGTELFKVNEKETAVFRDATSDFIRSDGLGMYTNETDDVSIGITDAGQIFFETNTMMPDERKMIVRVEDASGTVLWDGPADPRLQTRMISEPGGVDVYSLAVGESARVPVRIRWQPEEGGMYTLRFGRDCVDNVPIPEEMGTVTRTGADPGRWVVESGPYGRLCTARDDPSTKKPHDSIRIDYLNVTAPFAVTISDELDTAGF